MTQPRGSSIPLGVEVALWCIAFGLTGPFMIPFLVWRILYARRGRRKAEGR